MRSVIIRVDCDVCHDAIEEKNDGDNLVTFTVHGTQREMDLCGNCLGGTFLQEARPVTKKAKKKDKFSCDQCDKSFGTQRGLNHHRGQIHGGSE